VKNWFQILLLSNSTILCRYTSDIRRRMTPQPLKIRADVELTCFAYDGVLHIKEAMRAAAAAGGADAKDCKVKVSLVASPLYVITTQTLDKDFGVKLVDAAVVAATASIEANKGKIVVKVGR
jgi:translation initiation factor 2 subunit 1